MADQIVQGHVKLGGSFAKHRITGYVYQAINKEGVNPRLDVPLVSHVEGNLYQGGCLHGVRLPDGFKHVVSVYPWEQYALPEGCDRIEAFMHDSLDQNPSDAIGLAEEVINLLDDGPTLVHCQAGCNRSGLVAALVLIKLGHSPQEAVDLLRKSRSPLVLSNETFERFVLDYRA